MLAYAHFLTRTWPGIKFKVSAQRLRHLHVIIMYALLLLVLVPLCSHGQTLRYLDQIRARQAGFTALYEHPTYTDVKERYSFALSTFSPVPLTEDDLLWFEYPGKNLYNLTVVVPRVLLDELVWPREPQQVPFDVFGHEALAQPDGFLVPGKNIGGVGIVDLRDWDNIVNTDISDRNTGDNYFFHRVLWRDADADGDKDAFTCRARMEDDGSFTSNFMYYENPGGSDPARQEKWNSKIISTDVCDTMIYNADLTAEGKLYDVTFTIGYFADKLAVYWSTQTDGRWDDTGFIDELVIDESGVPNVDDHFFDVEVVDMNNDGRLDLLVTINSVYDGSLLIYEIPNDFRQDTYTKHVIASGFKSRSGLNGGGAPGQAMSFYPTTSTTGKRWILMSGDDEGTCYYYIPSSQDKDNWTYEQVNFLDEGEENIIGKPVVADFDGDGYSDIFVPLWNRGYVKAFTFAPAK